MHPSKLSAVALPKSFDFGRMCRDMGVPVAGPGHRHCRNGWVSVRCPFCGLSQEDGMYLGYSLKAGVFSCWRCGREGKGKPTVVAALVHVSVGDACDIIRRYSDEKVKLWENEAPDEPSAAELLGKLKKAAVAGDDGVAIGSREPLPCHLAYLAKRRFDLQTAIRLHNIRFCGKIGEYKFRIIMPIYGECDGRWLPVSFQGRDVTGESPLRYKACAKKDELLDHKTLLYGAERGYNGPIIVVEGPLDKWRMGRFARATFGIAYTQEQAAAIAKHSKAFIMYDCQEVQAQAQADKLAWDVRALGGNAVAIDVNSDGRDPAELEDAEALEIRQALGFTE